MSEARREEEPTATITMQLLTREIMKKLPRLGSTDNQGMRAVAQVKFFTPDAGWTWYAAEFDGADTFFDLVIGVEKELGHFSLSELRSIRGRLGLPVERDRYFKPTPLEEL